MAAKPNGFHYLSRSKKNEIEFYYADFLNFPPRIVIGKSNAVKIM